MAGLNDPNMFQQLDVGRAVQTGQRIQYNRLQNQSLQDDATERADMLQNRKKAQEIRTMYDKMPDQISALESEGMFDQADKLRENYITTRKSAIDLIEGTREYIDADNYKDFRQDLLTAGAITPELMPVEYSDDWFRKQSEERKRSLQKFTVESFENGAVMQQDYITENGQIRWDMTGEAVPLAEREKAKGKDGEKGKGKSFTFKAADTNAIGKQVERIFGGFYDPQTGQLKGLDPTEAARVQAVQEEAERIYSENAGYLPHSVAVARAARKLRISVEDYRNKEATNPLNLNLSTAQ